MLGLKLNHVSKRGHIWFNNNTESIHHVVLSVDVIFLWNTIWFEKQIIKKIFLAVINDDPHFFYHPLKCVILYQFNNISIHIFIAFITASPVPQWHRLIVPWLMVGFYSCESWNYWPTCMFQMLMLYLHSFFYYYSLLILCMSFIAFATCTWRNKMFGCPYCRVAMGIPNVRWRHLISPIRLPGTINLFL